jgi:hypothetical protein
VQFLDFLFNACNLCNGLYPSCCSQSRPYFNINTPLTLQMFVKLKTEVKVLRDLNTVNDEENRALFHSSYESKELSFGYEKFTA